MLKCWLESHHRSCRSSASAFRNRKVALGTALETRDSATIKLNPYHACLADGICPLRRHCAVSRQHMQGKHSTVMQAPKPKPLLNPIKPINPKPYKLQKGSILLYSVFACGRSPSCTATVKPKQGIRPMDAILKP